MLGSNYCRHQKAEFYFKVHEPFSVSCFNLLARRVPATVPRVQPTMIALRAALRVGLSALRSSPAASPAVVASRVGMMMRPFSSSAPAMLATAVRRTGACAAAPVRAMPSPYRALFFCYPAAKKPVAKKKAPAKKAVAKKKPATKAKARTTTRRAAPKKGKAAAGAKKRTVVRRRKPLTDEQRAKLRAKAKREELRAIAKPPKAAPTAYALFVKNFQRGNGDPITEMKHAAAAWRTLPLNEKTKLQEQSAALGAVYKTEYARWAKSVGRVDILKLNTARRAAGRSRLRMPEPKVKRPLSGYITFFKEEYNKGTLDVPGAAPIPSNRAKRAGELWRAMPAAQKAVSVPSHRPPVRSPAARAALQRSGRPAIRGVQGRARVSRRANETLRCILRGERSPIPFPLLVLS